MLDLNPVLADANSVCISPLTLILGDTVTLNQGNGLLNDPNNRTDIYFSIAFIWIMMAFILSHVHRYDHKLLFNYRKSKLLPSLQLLIFLSRSDYSAHR